MPELISITLQPIDLQIKAAIGYMARVVEGGEIRVGDPVTRLPVQAFLRALASS